MADEKTGDDGATQTGAETTEITPELESKFAEVFGSDDPRAASREDGDNKDTPTPNRRRATRRDQAQTVEESTDEVDGDGGKDEPEPQDSQKQDTPPKPKPAAGKDDEVPDPVTTLPPVLRKVAERAGWSEDELREAMDLNPEATTNTLHRMHRSFNDLSTRFASFANGQQQQQQQFQQAPPQQFQQRQQQFQQQPQAQQGPQSLAPEHLMQHLFGQDYRERLTVDYGEKFIPEVLAPLMQQVVAPVMQIQQHFEQQRLHAIAQEVNSSFEQLAKQLPDEYGDLRKGKLSNEQIAFRTQVLQQADAIRAGAQFQGVPMTVAESIEYAHFQLSAPMLQRMEREKLTQSVRTRNSRITARPTNRPAGKESVQRGGEKSQEAAEAAFIEKGNEIGFFEDT